MHFPKSSHCDEQKLVWLGPAETPGCSERAAWSAGWNGTFAWAGQSYDAAVPLTGVCFALID